MIFEWDEEKNKKNYKKHGVTFHVAESVFHDSNARLIYDDNHSSDEDRYILLGMSDDLKLLVVVHIYFEDIYLDQDQLIRIISARKASQSEEKQYMRFKDER